MRFWLFAAFVLLGSAASAQPLDCQTGWTAFQARNYVGASDDLTRCLAAELPARARAQVLQLRAQSYAEQKRFDLAIQDQQASIQAVPPKDVWPHVMLGAFYREAGQAKESIAALREAMKYDEDGPGSGPGMAVHYHLAQTLHGAKRYQEAIEVITKGIPKQPDYGYALYQRALSYEALGQREQAKRDLFRAAELAPQDGYEPEIAAKLKANGFEVKVRVE
jgi:tetratricopeptide (TPR) repeat protein